MKSEDEIFAIGFYTAQVQEIQAEIARLERKLDRVKGDARLWGYEWQNGEFVEQAPGAPPDKPLSVTEAQGYISEIEDVTVTRSLYDEEVD